MEDNLLNMVIAIVAIFLFFIFPVYVAYEKKDDISYALALKYTQEFVDNIRSKGYLDDETYNNYVRSLNATGNSYNISLKHNYVRYDPASQGEKGSYVREEEVIRENTILNYINNGYIYTMNEDDDFNVQISNSNVTLATVIYNLITVNVSNVNTRIYVNYGGKILATKYDESKAYQIFTSGKVTIKEGAPIPTGFTYSSGSSDTAIVIANNAGEKWVWIPVKDFTKFVRTGDTINSISNQSLVDGYWEVILDKNNMPVNWDDMSEYAKGAFKISLRTNGNLNEAEKRYGYIQDMYKSVSKYGGFYVKEGTTSDYGNAFSEIDNVGYVPITAVQWEMMISFIGNNSTRYDTLQLKLKNGVSYTTSEMKGTSEHICRNKDGRVVIKGAKTLQTLFILPSKEEESKDNTIEVKPLESQPGITLTVHKSLGDAQSGVNAIKPSEKVIVNNWDSDEKTKIYYRVGFSVTPDTGTITLNKENPTKYYTSNYYIYEFTESATNRCASISVPVAEATAEFAGKKYNAVSYEYTLEHEQKMLISAYASENDAEKLQNSIEGRFVSSGEKVDIYYRVDYDNNRFKSTSIVMSDANAIKVDESKGYIIYNKTYTNGTTAKATASADGGKVEMTSKINLEKVVVTAKKTTNVEIGDGETIKTKEGKYVVEYWVSYTGKPSNISLSYTGGTSAGINNMQYLKVYSVKYVTNLTATQTYATLNITYDGIKYNVKSKKFDIQKTQ